MLSMTVLNSTPIDPVSSIGASGSGWVASVVLKGLTSIVGTVDGSKLSLTVSDPGYDTSGNTTTVVRTITGVTFVRRQYPNGNTKMVTTDGTNVTILISLDDYIYSGSTVMAATLVSGFYTGSVAGAAGTISNQSVEAYPKPGWGWNMPQQLRSTGNTFPTEGIPTHRHMRNGQQVACVKYTATDGTNSGSTSVVGAPTLSTRNTIGNIPEVFAANVDNSTLTQAAACTVNAQVYPWIGSSSAVLDLAVSGVAWPTAVPQTLLRFTCDRTGGYGGAFAYVDGIGAGTPQVSTTAATARANPYSTVVAALAAVQTFNNANKGHNDLGGATVRLMDTAGISPRTHTVSADGPYTNPTTYCFIERDPAASQAVTVTWSTLCQMSNMLAWGGNGLIIAPTSGQYAMSGNLGTNELVYVHDCTIDGTGSTNNICLQNRKFYQNLTITGTSPNFAGFGGGSTVNTHLASGIVATSANNPTNLGSQLMIGNVLTATTVGVLGGEGSDGALVINNKLLSVFMENTGAVTYSRGFWALQNVIETNIAQGLKVFADGDHTTIINFVQAYNIAVGERSSHFYNDDAASKVVPNGLFKKGCSRFNIFDNINIKTDTFNAGAGSVGNWAFTYGVGNVGDVSLFGDVGRGAAAVPHNDNTDPAYLGNAWLTTSEYNLFRTALGFTQTQIMDMFTSYTAAPRAVPAQGGNYKPLVGSTQLRSRVPAGLAGLAFDIAGVARKNDGTGAAGAYEV